MTRCFLQRMKRNFHFINQAYVTLCIKLFICVTSAALIIIVVFNTALGLMENESKIDRDGRFQARILDLEQKNLKCVNVHNLSATTVTPHTTVDVESSLPWIFAVTPTHKRLTQLLDLTSLCQTLMLIKNFVWIVVEDGYITSDVVTDLLNRCKVKVIHLCARNITEWSTPTGRGVAQRNVGLQWIRKNCYLFQNCSGSLFFMDDDNKYDLRIFDQIRQVKYIGVWPVAYAGFLYFEGPVCINNSAVEWHALFAPKRGFPIDMAGFAINVQLLLSFPDALFGYNPQSRLKADSGWQETRFLENFATDRFDHRIECRGSSKEALVWHIRAKIKTSIISAVKWKYDIRT